MSVFNNNLLLGAGGQAAGGDFSTDLIPNSVWLDGSDDYFSFVTDSGSAVAHSTTKVIMATWFQLTSLASEEALMMLGSGSSATTTTGIYVQSSSRIAIQSNAGAAFAKTNDLLRDSAWYHILASFDLAQSGTDKAELYINGIEVTSYNGTDGRGSMGTSFSSTTNYEIGRIYQGGNFTGYLAQSLFLDGKSIQAGDYAITDFLDTFTFGTNGSQYVPKSDSDMETLVGDTKSSTHTNSAILTYANASTPGLDSSSNPNTFTNNGTIATAQQRTNTPSNTGLLWAVNGTPGGANGENVGTISNGALVATVDGSGSSKQTVVSTLFITTGKFYTEIQQTNTGLYPIIGVAADPRGAGAHWAGASSDYKGTSYNYSGTIYKDGTSTSFGDAWDEDDRLAIAVDVDAGKVWFAVLDGSTVNWQGSGSPDPATGDDPAYTFTAGTPVAVQVGTGGGGGATEYTLYPESTDWNGAAPTDYLAWNTANITAPDYQGIDFFKPVLYTGNGTAIGSGGLAITGTGFEPGFVWVKDRSADSTDNMLFDRVRGTTKFLSSSADGDGSAAGEGTDTESLTAFGSDGFTLGSNADVNVNTNTYVSWNWKTVTGSGSTTSPAGDTASTSIVSEAGHFSAVSFTGTGSITTVGHGLGGIPQAMFFKLTPEQGSWVVYHEGISSTPTASAGKYLIWNANGAAGTSSAFFDDTAPTANVFTVGASANTNDSGKAIFVYCFKSIPGVCKVGSYRGNGETGTTAANGPFVYTGFKPSYIMIKNSDATGNWDIMDTVRSTFNPAQLILEANTSDDESSGEAIDILSDGFRIRSGDWNGDGNITVYVAMAELGGNGTLPPIYGR